ncbi:MAG: MATE family efflux transporter [Vicinamibacteraceae bacterium]|nr:MATE family efflux transporter [Vicinamibacteraceae bacterium]
MSDAPPRSSRFDRTIVDGPVGRAVWKMAWPTLLQNVIGGMQGLIDHAMVGHYVGYTANAAIGVSLQVFLVVIVFIGSLYTGLGVLVARFAGAGDAEKVDRTFYQALLATLGAAFGIVAPVGYLAAPALLDLVKASPAVQQEALSYLRVMFVGGVGMLGYFLLAGALRAAGDAQTPLRLGLAMTVLNVGLNITLIGGAGPIPALGTVGAAIGTAIASLIVTGTGLWLIVSKKAVVHLPPPGLRQFDPGILRSLLRFGLPAGLQGVAMNVAGVLLLRFIGGLPQSAAAQAAYAVGYTELFSFITWTSVGLMGAAAAVVGQSLGAGKPDRCMAAVRVASRMGLGVAAFIGVLFVVIPRWLLAAFGMTDPEVVGIAIELLRYLAFSGFFISVALVHTGALQGTGDTRSPLYISLASQIGVPIGLCTLFAATGTLEAHEIWTAIVLGHVSRAALSVVVFRRGKWRQIAVDLGPATA